jgi:hypothetical protein
VPGGIGPVNPSGVMTAMRRAENAAFESIRQRHPEQGIRIRIDNAPAKIESINNGTLFR